MEISLLDLIPVRSGYSHLQAMEQSLRLAQHVESLNFKRVWIAEHHNAASLVSSATPLLIQHIAAGTNTIRVGSGGVMLPNHSPLIVAEQFGTLATLFPGRIDLGLGRAPGTDQLTAKALRRSRVETVEEFPQDVQELQFYLSDESADSPVRAIPGQGLRVPLYILGSSTFSARLAALLGLPYAFASHFAPAQLHEALAIYREGFRPSDQLAAPYVIAGANVVVADTDERAGFLSSTGNMFALDIIRNTRRPLQPPEEQPERMWTERERALVHSMRTYAFIGSKQTVLEKLSAFVKSTEVDELMVSSYVYDLEEQLHSFSLLAELKVGLNN